jgi:DNA-binding transcriptional LysR family regulator
MELMQLEMFVAVVEEGTVRRAADRVFRTQPAVSIALGKLQREIGTALLEDTRRTNREPTEAGQTLYEYASRMLGIRDEVLSRLQGQNRRCAGSVHIGVESEKHLKFIMQVGINFNQEQSGVRVEAHRDRAETLMLKLRDRAIDLALLSKIQENQEIDPNLVVKPILRFEGGSTAYLIGRRAYQSSAMKLLSAKLNALCVGPTSRLPRTRFKNGCACFGSNPMELKQVNCGQSS